MKFVISFLAIINLVVSYFLFTEIQGLKSKPAIPPPNSVIQVPSGEEIDLSGFATKDYVNSAIAQIPETSPSTETVTVVKETTDSSKKTTIIPITATYSTQNLNWEDVPNSDFYLDLVNDYGEAASAYWEAFVYEQHGNGRVFARLFDVTHGIGVVGSDVETNSATSKLEISAGNLGIWRGKNLYRVQIKSEKGFPVFFDSGRLKVSY